MSVVFQLRVAYRKDDGTVGFIFPFRSGSQPVATFPVAFDPCIRVQLTHSESVKLGFEWLTPELENPKVARIMGFQLPDHNFKDFALYQGATNGWHPLRRACLGIFDSLGPILFCFFKFLHHFYLDIPAGDGVLFRDDARILYAQTSEFLREPDRAAALGRRNNYRHPTLVFRMQGLHYAWWRAGDSSGGNCNATGTARIFCIEADREIYLASGRHFSLFGYDY
jgi:hypothetical protein